MSAKYERRRQAPDASQAYQILGERLETARRIDRIRREDRIRRDALEHAISGDDRAIGVAHERARTGRVSRCMNDLQNAGFKLQFGSVKQFSALFVVESVRILTKVVIEFPHRFNFVA